MTIVFIADWKKLTSSIEFSETDVKLIYKIQYWVRFYTYHSVIYFYSLSTEI